MTRLSLDWQVRPAPGLSPSIPIAASCICSATSFSHLPEDEFTALHDPTQHGEVALETLVADYQDLYRRRTGSIFPQDPFVQLDLAIKAVFGSWKSERATFYRAMNQIPDDLGPLLPYKRWSSGIAVRTAEPGRIFSRSLARQAGHVCRVPS